MHGDDHGPPCPLLSGATALPSLAPPYQHNYTKSLTRPRRADRLGWISRTALAEPATCHPAGQVRAVDYPADPRSARLRTAPRACHPGRVTQQPPPLTRPWPT